MNAVRPYQRRRRAPVAALVAVLAIAAVLTWVMVLTRTGGTVDPTQCPPPATGSLPGEVLEADALDEVAPAPPPAGLIRVLNAGGQRGQANLVAAQLADLGFVEAAAPMNDPFHPDGDMRCGGQLRFGPAGEPAAVTLALVLPCTELVRDERPDPTVDVSVGTGFTDVDPSRPVRDVLGQLANPGAGTVGLDNTAEADPQAAPVPAAVDPDDLAAARDVAC